MNEIEQVIKNARKRWEECMGEANDDVGEAHRLYMKKGPTKLSSAK